MMSFARRLLAVVSMAGLIGTSAYGAMKPKPAYHCVNAKNQAVKGANTQAQCKTPYRWVKVGAMTQASKKAKPTTAYKAKKGHVASVEQPTEGKD